jgi:hypothetical protein
VDQTLKARVVHQLQWIALISILLCTDCWATEALTQGSLQFDSEEIVMDLKGGTVEVTGTYHFRVMGGRSPAQPMLYPYPQDARLGTARTLRLEYRQADNKWVPLKFDELPPRGVRWHLPPVESDLLTVRTVYRQETPGTYARYIVTTTAYWGTPLRRARFEIRLPPGARDPSFSYPFRPSGPSVRVWTYEADDFLPRKDIVVSYRR